MTGTLGIFTCQTQGYITSQVLSTGDHNYVTNPAPVLLSERSFPAEHPLHMPLVVHILSTGNHNYATNPELGLLSQRSFSEKHPLHVLPAGHICEIVWQHNMYVR